MKILTERESCSFCCRIPTSWGAHYLSWRLKLGSAWEWEVWLQLAHEKLMAERAASWLTSQWHSVILWALLCVALLHFAWRELAPCSFPANNLRSISILISVEAFSKDKKQKWKGASLYLVSWKSIRKWWAFLLAFHRGSHWPAPGILYKGLEIINPISRRGRGHGLKRHFAMEEDMSSGSSSWR